MEEGFDSLELEEIGVDSLELGVGINTEGFDRLELGVGMQRWGLTALNWVWACGGGVRQP